MKTASEYFKEACDKFADRSNKNNIYDEPYFVEANQLALEQLKKAKDSLGELLECSERYGSMIHGAISEKDLQEKMYPFAEENGISIERVILDVAMLRKEVAA